LTMLAKQLNSLCAAFKRRLCAIADHFLDLDHGTRHCRVPAAWRQHVHRLSLYALSSFFYAVVGAVLLLGLCLHPERTLYAGEWVEMLLWFWQAGASYWCDVIDLGIPSISHPIDRFSAVVFTVQQCVKYGLVRCKGPLAHWLALSMSSGFILGLYCFHRSGVAVKKCEMQHYLRWHTLWHLSLPLNALSFIYLHYFGDTSWVSCKCCSLKV